MFGIVRISFFPPTTTCNAFLIIKEHEILFKISIVRYSLIASLIILITGIAKKFDVLDERYSTMIMIGILVIQTILFILVFFIIIISKRKITAHKNHEVRIIRFKFKDRFIKGNTDILPENIYPTNPMKSALFKIYLEIENVSEIPEIGISKTSTERIIPDIKKHIVNFNTEMGNNNFIFDADIIVDPNEKINFRINKDTVIKLFFLGECYLP